MVNVNFAASECNVKRGLVSFLQKCFPKKNPEFLEKNLVKKNYDMFYLKLNNRIHAVCAVKQDNNGDIYITHVCKDPDSNMTKTFLKLFKKIKETYGPLQRYYLNVREKTNPAALKVYKNAGFRIRTNLPLKLTKNRNNYITVMNTTKPDTLDSMIRNITVGTRFDFFNMGRINNSQKLQRIRNRLLEVTRERWLLHKQKWMDNIGESPWMHLIYGNLAVTFFVMVNQYLDSTIGPSVFPYSEVPFTMDVIAQTLHNTGANYFYNESDPGARASHKNIIPLRTSYTKRPLSVDFFKNDVYNKTYTQLKKLAKSKFDEIYRDMIARETPPLNGSVKEYLKYVNRNFTGRGNTNIMKFYTHNLGIYQFLAMYGYHNPTKTVYPYSGNCTIIAIFRIALLERLSKGKFRGDLSFVVQSKNVNGTQEVCHYGLRSKNMSIANRKSGGNMQGVTGYPGYYTMANISTYNKMYDVLTTNSIYRAKLRAERDQRFVSRKQILNAFSNTITLNNETRKIHSHKMNSVTSHTPGLNYY